MPHYKHNWRQTIAHLSFCFSLGTLLGQGTEYLLPNTSATMKQLIPAAATGIGLFCYSFYRGQKKINTNPQLVLPNATPSQIEQWNMRLEKYKRNW